MQSVLYLFCKVNLAFVLCGRIWGKKEHFMKTIIRELRRERKLSQEELAEAVGTTRQTITSIEVGKYTASLPLAYKIARFFGKTIEEVFDFSELED